ncbi:Uu.00g004130.m01.CDS01 [Anthostomella pinea]|uniref:Uu.00g004130.m01.CDS01 n=1 Tax=Anthostomella pinea TaxID=933095 RepID=A0AAI8VK00_9PEZI|nr:Uu.00g004130.m01.CDS01 [Anthostomella pinea]
MGKKRKASSGPPQPKGPREYDPADARLGPVNTFKDLADDQERHFLEQDEILFDDGAPKSKRRKALEDEEDFLDNSDEEILDYGDDGSEDDEEEEEEEEESAPKANKPKSAKSAKRKGDESEEEEGDTGFWGSSRKDYYNGDQIETTVDAEEEENEARRLQRKKLSKMTEKDFFNEDEWLAAEPEDAEQDEVVTEVMDVQIPADMGPDERYRLLQARYPELPFLADELLQLQPQLVELQKEAEGQELKNLKVVKYRILSSYVATLAMYFAILTSPARDSTGVMKALDPAELRDHEVMGTLLECREAWKKVEHMNAPEKAKAADSLSSPPEDEFDVAGEEEMLAPQPVKETNKEKRAKAKAERKAKAIEESFADLDSLIATNKKPKKKTSKLEPVADDDNSDFGEEETIDARVAADKAARKKSLRFYTSQIVQKANRRANAGRDAGGDEDIPYRERLRERQARLLAEAQKRGKMDSKHGADLGDASDEEDERVANAVRGQDDEYYNIVAASSNKRKDEKAARAAAHAAAGVRDRVVEVEEVAPDGKRRINYQIEKNKGLAPKRKKEVRNGRVKKRKQYDTKKKKLSSMKAVYKGGEGRGYSGETTGIKSGLIKSVKL